MIDKIPCILVQNNAFQNLFSKVSRYGWDNNIVVIDRCCADASFDINDCGVDWSIHGPVLVYGAAEFVNACAKSEHLAPYIYNDREAFSMKQLLSCGRMLFNHDGGVVKASVISKWLSSWNAIGDTPAQHFIRPDLAHKAFNGGVYDAERWEAMIKEKNLPEDLACYISSVKPLPDKEYRCWVINGKIVAVSQYMEKGELNVVALMDDVLTEFLSKVAQTFFVLKTAMKRNLPDCYTVDFAVPQGKDLAHACIMELNCINSSGFYGFDNVPSILKAWMDFLKGDYVVEHQCPNCDSKKIREEIMVDKFSAMIDNKEVELSASVPVLACNECAGMWTDYRTEEIRDLMVKNNSIKVLK